MQTIINQKRRHPPAHLQCQTKCVPLQWQTTLKSWIQRERRNIEIRDGKGEEEGETPAPKEDSKATREAMKDQMQETWKGVAEPMQTGMEKTVEYGMEPHKSNSHRY
jgi:hypothetical protein